MIYLLLKTLKSNCGKIDKQRSSRTISENAKETSYNFITHSFKSKNSNLSESINTYLQYDDAYAQRVGIQQWTACKSY